MHSMINLLIYTRVGKNEPFGRRKIVSDWGLPDWIFIAKVHMPVIVDYVEGITFGLLTGMMPIAQ